jgi:hypothetical protein
MLHGSVASATAPTPTGPTLIIRQSTPADRPLRTLGTSLLKRGRSLDLGRLGYGMVAVALVIWPGAAIVCKKCIQPKERT